MHPPILGEITPGAIQRHLIKLPGDALTNDEPRPVISVAGAKPGPVLFVNGGVHGGEYPAVEAVIRLGKTLDPQKISGTVILMPVLNLPAFRTRTPFVCPIDNVNPNRVFPGDPCGSYSEQMTHALINEFVVHADAYVDLHGGDIPEALVPFVICRSEAGLTDPKSRDIAARSQQIAMAFGVPYVLAVSKPVQPSKGLSSYAAAVENGIPAILAEAGAMGQMQEEAVKLLINGVINVMRYLGMVESLADASKKANDETRMTSVEESPNREVQKPTQRVGAIANGSAAATIDPTILTRFEWIYTRNSGMWYPDVAPGDLVTKGQQIGRIGDLFGDTLEKITSPVTGFALFLTINPSVLENGLLMGIGAK
jgi:uncharacterized protein